MKPWVRVGCVLASMHSCMAQCEVGFSGYVVDFPAYQRFRTEVAQLQGIDREQLANIARVRLRPTLSLWTDAEVSMEYEVAALYSSARLKQQVPVGQNKRQVVNLSATPVKEEKWQVMHFVDRLQVRQGLSFGDLTIGRQRIAWGTGRLWNPTDLFNPLNPITVSKIEKDGVDAVLLKASFGNFTDLSLVYNPQKNWNTSNAGFRFRTNYNEFDMSLMGGYFDRRVVVGADFAGNLLKAGVRGEGIISADPDDVGSDFVKFILGTDYQFTSELYGMLEYHFNGEGRSDRGAYDLNRLAAGEILNVGRNYLALSVSYLVHPLVTTAGSFIANLDDGSSYLNASVTISITNELSLLAGTQLFAGSAFEEYWYYPNAAYLKADVFF